MATSVVLVVIAIGLYSAYDKISYQDQSWQSYADSNKLHTNALTGLQKSLGYGGFIHSFKNYILRGDPFYAGVAERNIVDARKYISTLYQLDRNPAISIALNDIENTVNAYQSKLLIAQQNIDQMSKTELDNLVRVDDAPALAALAVINNHFTEFLTQQQKSSELLRSELNSLLQYGGLVAFVFILYSIGAVFLIFKTHQSELQAKDSMGQVNQLFDKSPDGMLLVNEAGEIIRSNEQATAILEYAPHELASLTVEDFIPASDRANHHAHRQSYQKVGGSRVMGSGKDLFAITKSGNEVPLIISLNQIPQGGSHYYMVSFRDVTEHRRISEELIIAKEKAEQSAQAKVAFLATMSHELRTPLNAVLGFANVMKVRSKQQDDKRYLDIAESIDKSGKHLLNIVNDVLDFAQVDNGNIKLDERPLDPTNVISDAISTFIGQAIEKGIMIKTKMDNLPKTVLLDSHRFNQILYNLIGNAVKFTSEGEIVIAADAKPLAKGKLKLTVSVSDSGIGISNEQMNKIFDPFTQAESHISRRFGGTGLGLAIAKKMAECMGGSIAVSSVPGEGSTFTFNVVVENISHVETSAMIDQYEQLIQQGKTYEGKILVVDDVETNFLTIEAILKPLGFELVWAENGQMALELYPDHDFSMILMDIHMPQMNGIKTAQIIREYQISKNKVVPIVAWTADILRNFEEENKGLWDGVLTKPTMPTELIAKISNTTMSVH